MTSAQLTEYSAQILQLVELQKIDDDIFTARQEMENAPKELGELESRFQEIDKRRTGILDKKTHLEAQLKRIDQEIEDDASRLKKSKNKLMQVANAHEYNAMISEMNTMEKISRARKEERVTMLEELQTQTDALADIEGSHQELAAELAAKRDGMEERLKGIRKRLEALQVDRDKASVNIPHPVFQRYEFIRVRLEHPVIVPVRDAVCSGCNIIMPPQYFIDLQRGQQILSCPNCQRLIYWADHFDAGDSTVQDGTHETPADGGGEEPADPGKDMPTPAKAAPKPKGEGAEKGTAKRQPAAPKAAGRKKKEKVTEE